MSEVMTFRRPAYAAFSPLIESLMYFEGELPEGRERVLPSGTSQLLINLAENRLETFANNGIDVLDSTAGAALSGVRSLPADIDAGGRCALLIVNFRPGGTYPFFGSSALATSDRLVALESLWAVNGALLRERLLETSTPASMFDIVEAELRDHVDRPLLYEPGLAFAIKALNDGVPVLKVSEALGLTAKKFVRYFSDRVGLTPKRFARVRRLQRTLSSIQSAPTIDWAQLASRCGYFDQAHLIHDFHELTGSTPTQYRLRAKESPNHLEL